MTKLKLFLFLIITILIYSITSSVQSVYYSIYKQYKTTPLLVNGPSLWEINKIQYPSVILDNGIYKMWYSGHNNYYWSIGYAVSLDGINWFKYPYNPILTWDNNVSNPRHFITPSVLKDGDIYKMWFTSSFTDHNDGDFTIGYAASSNGISWSNINYRQLTSSQNWDNIGLTHPNIIKINNTYYLYYAARKNPYEWTIGFATSTDGLNWYPYSGNPVIQNRTNWWERGHNIGPYVLFDSTNNKYQMWYNTTNLGSITSIAYAESNDGITWIKPVEKNPVLLNEIPDTFDFRGVSRPSLMKIGNTYLLWYAGTSPLNTWNIGLAYFGDTPVAQPTPSGSLFPTIAPTDTPIPTNTPIPTATPVPTATPIPTPTPTPKPKEPIVIIPGMFASWNKEAILEGKSNYSSSWKLLPFVKEYDGIILTLKNLGYTEGDLLYVWPYDWRKNVAENASKLQSYLNSNVFSKYPNEKISLVGHSLGGLIARSWAQTNNNKEKLNHLITVASPNFGVIQPYRAWEGGEISQDSSPLTIALNLLLHIGKNKLQTDRETIQQLFPVLKDLLPTAPYLIRKTDNTEITKNQMYVWNLWLETLNTSVSSIYSIFHAIGGTGNNTPHTFVVSQPSKIDFLLGNWQDGKPVETKTVTGDGTVTTERSVFTDDTNTILSKDHSGLISSKEGVKAILDTLALPYTEEQIVEGSNTKFNPSLLFIMQSPATMSVSYNGQTYLDLNGIIFIPNAADGSYNVTVTGTDSGLYHLSIGQFGTTESNWSDVVNSTSPQQTETYTINFQQNNLLDTPITSITLADWLTQIELKLQELEKITDKKNTRLARIDIAIAKKLTKPLNPLAIKQLLEHVLSVLSSIRKQRNSQQAKQLTFDIGDFVMHTYISQFSNNDYYPAKKLTNQIETLNQKLTKLLTQIEKKNPDSEHLLLLQKGMTLFEEGRTALSKNERAKAWIYFFQTKLLFDEVL